MRVGIPFFMLTLFVASIAACTRGENRGHDTGRDSASRFATSHDALPRRCGRPANGIRLTPDSIGGLPVHATIGELRALCPTARRDDAGLGGTSVPALVIEFPGATIWAMQSKYDAPADSLNDSESPDFWAAQGDSLRFASGELIPRTAGGFRSFDSLGVVGIDRGDDTDGTMLVICRFPQFAAAFGNMFPEGKDTGVVSLSRISAHDTSTFWRMDFVPGRNDPAAEHCPGATHR
jgi:hypothetical protein